jgi:hypothetical protein
MSMQQIIKMLAKAEAHRKADQERKADKEEILSTVKEDRKASQEELLARMDDYHEKRMAMFDAYEKRMMGCLGQTEANTERIEQDPGIMKSVEEHQDIPTEDVAVMPVGEPRKRRGARKSTAGRRGKPKELAQCRQKEVLPCNSGMAEKKPTRNIRIQESRESSKEIAAAEVRTARHAKVARRKRNVVGKTRIRNNAVRGTSNSRTLRRRQRATQGNNRTRKRNPQVLRRESTGNVIQTFGKITGLKFAERVGRSTVGLRRIRKWTLWRCRPPPKRKKKSCT